MNKTDKTSHFSKLLLKQNWIFTFQKEVVCKEGCSICCPQKSCMLPTSPCVSLLPVALNSVGNLWFKSGETQKPPPFLAEIAEKSSYVGFHFWRLCDLQEIKC